MSRPRGRPPATGGPASEARRRILDAAQVLFAELGFDATPTKRIAEGAGVPQGLLFYYFGTKEGLLEQLVAERSFLPELEHELRGSRPQEPRQGLWDLAQRFLAVVGRREAVARILMRESMSHESVAERFSSMREAAIAIIWSYLEEAGVPSGKAAVVARSFLYTLLVTAVIDGPAAPEDFLRQLIGALLGDA